MANLRTLISAAKALQIAKLLLLSLIGVSVAVLVGTHTGSVLSAAAPPYLFLLVHVIIAVIWKLSDRKPLIAPTFPAATEPAARATLPEAVSPDSDESCVTDDDSGEKSPASVGSALAGVEKKSGDNDHKDETLRAIVLKKADTLERTRRPEVEGQERAGGRTRMKKSETFKESSEVTSTALAAADDDEWNQRFEAFIKKNYDQIRLQNGGTYRRHVDFENHASH